MNQYTISRRNFLRVLGASTALAPLAKILSGGAAIALAETPAAGAISVYSYQHAICFGLMNVLHPIKWTPEKIRNALNESGDKPSLVWQILQDMHSQYSVHDNRHNHFYHDPRNRLRDSIDTPLFDEVYNRDAEQLRSNGHVVPDLDTARAEVKRRFNLPKNHFKDREITALKDAWDVISECLKDEPATFQDLAAARKAIYQPPKEDLIDAQPPKKHGKDGRYYSYDQSLKVADFNGDIGAARKYLQYPATRISEYKPWRGECDKNKIEQLQLTLTTTSYTELIADQSSSCERRR